jgi:hypothetical protein
MAPNPTVQWRDRGALEDELRVPRVVTAAVLMAILVGIVIGVVGDGALGFRLVRASFFASSFGYLAVSLLDFWEHFRLEHEATGRWLAARVVPPGETANHVATIAVVVALLVLARPLRAPLGPRDLAVLLAPVAFLALGWRDELVYHRRRCAHREDIMHTVAHLAAGAMLSSFVAMRLVPW